MKITVFTGNQPRHVSLIRQLAGVAEEVFAVQECNTLFPGEIADLSRTSPVMQTYFSRVMAAEHAVFGEVGFSPARVRHLAIKSGELNRLERPALAEAMESDVFIVLGASYIEGWLIDELVERRAINIHMGIAPYYRGNSCNFWALYDGNPNLVGATVQVLTKGLDSGAILFHALPRPGAVDPFELAMRAVNAGHRAVVEAIAGDTLFSHEAVAQDRSREIRYTRNADFSDQAAQDFLDRRLNEQDVAGLFERAPERELLRPVYV